MSQDKGFSLPVGEQTLVAIVGLLLTFVLSVLMLRQFKTKPQTVPSMPLEEKDQTTTDEEIENLKSKKESVLDKFNKSKEEEKVIKEIESIIEANPDSIANIISSWLSEDSK
jgi:flagellar biosynthesis/type III secretory pathway M-ring protein FliF/YscJ